MICVRKSVQKLVLEKFRNEIKLGLHIIYGYPMFEAFIKFTGVKF